MSQETIDKVKADLRAAFQKAIADEGLSATDALDVMTALLIEAIDAKAAAMSTSGLALPDKAPELWGKPHRAQGKPGHVHPKSLCDLDRKELYACKPAQARPAALYRPRRLAAPSPRGRLFLAAIEFNARDRPCHAAGPPRQNEAGSRIHFRISRATRTPKPFLNQLIRTDPLACSRLPAMVAMLSRISRSALVSCTAARRASALNMRSASRIVRPSVVNITTP